jgi:outer membrane protein assembly factor BamD (BamD/ComL family)
MKRLHLFLVFGLVIFFISCQNSKQIKNLSTKEKIEVLEMKLFGQESQYNGVEALQLMHLYQRYADSLPADSLSPEYLFKAADISLYQQEGHKTLAILDQLINGYQKHPHVAMSAFLKAFVYDTKLNDTAAARSYYTAFIDSFPDHEFADDAKNAIRNIGKSPEELIREFEKMNE